MVISDGIPAVPRNRKPRNSVPNPSAEEKNNPEFRKQGDEMESLERKSVKELRTLFQPNMRNVQVHSATLVVLMNQMRSGILRSVFSVYH
jgi:hypothetical protein